MLPLLLGQIVATESPTKREPPLRFGPCGLYDISELSDHFQVEVNEQPAELEGDTVRFTLTIAKAMAAGLFQSRTWSFGCETRRGRCYSPLRYAGDPRRILYRTRRSKPPRSLSRQQSRSVCHSDRILQSSRRSSTSRE
jgi:hypothetical protein